MPPLSPRAAAVLAITAVNVLWGSTFLVIKWGLATMGEASGLGSAAGAWTAFLALRFALAVPAAAAVLPGALSGLAQGALWRDAFWIALPGAAGHALQTVGLVHVNPAASAFLTSLYVPATPFFAWLLFRERMPGALLPAVAAALAGLWIMNPPTSGAFGAGDALSAACGLAFGWQIVTIDRFSARHPPAPLTLAASVWIAAAYLAAACAVPGGRQALSAETLGRLAASPAAWGPVVFLGVAATSLPLWIMNRFQHRLGPSHAAVLYAMEPVFAALLSFLFFGERFGPAALAGGALVVVANVWAGRPKTGGTSRSGFTSDCK